MLHDIVVLVQATATVVLAIISVVHSKRIRKALSTADYAQKRLAQHLAIVRPSKPGPGRSQTLPDKPDTTEPAS